MRLDASSPVNAEKVLLQHQHWSSPSAAISHYRRLLVEKLTETCGMTLSDRLQILSPLTSFIIIPKARGATNAVT